MSPDGPDSVPPPGDPFQESDPAARERQRRRAEREAKRTRRSTRTSLAARVSGALDGATSKGREAIEHGRERVNAPHEPPPEAAEPPPFRRAPVPRDDAVEPKAPTPPAAAPKGPPESPLPTPAPSPEPAPRPRAVLHGETDDFAPPAPVPARRDAPPPAPPGGPEPGVGGGGSRRRPTASGSGSIWFRRLVALVVILLLAGGAAFAISRSGGEDPEPVAKGPRTLKTIDVTIPEGLASEEMAAVAKDAGLKGDYERATAKPPKSFDAKRIGFPSGAGLEGFLFPATYNLERGAPVQDLVDQQLEAFDQNIASVDLKAAKKKNLTTYDVVTIASMIEREVQVAEERPLVAAVIYNRLSDGEALGIDATLRYEVGFDKPLTESQLASDSPYNTRTNPGLPPTPIGNPGLDSLKAAADPAGVDFKYYVFKPGSCGEHTFTADFDEFLRLSDEYQAALAAEGGQPDDC